MAGRKAILENYIPSSRNKILKRGMGGDLTLRIDQVSESAIHSSLKRDLGNSFIFLSEEIGEVRDSKGGISSETPVIVCDPLDGSHNAQVGIPFFSLSLSVIVPESDRAFANVIAALILSIKTEDEFSGVKNEGAFHNSRLLKPRTNATSDRVKTLLVETGDIDYLRDKILPNFSEELIYKTRLLGSAALSYCLLADGSADALIFAQPGGARTIDSPAGYLICKEAGCLFLEVSDIASRRRDVDKVEVGFDSKINILGAQNEHMLTKLASRLGRLP